MALCLPRTPRMLLSAPFALSLWDWVFPPVSMAALGIEPVDEDSQPATVKQSPMVSSSEDTHVIVVGFMGGLFIGTTRTILKSD